MNPRTLVVCGVIAGVGLLVLLQFARTERAPGAAAVDGAVAVLEVDLVAAKPDFVTQINRLVPGASLEQLRKDVAAPPVEDDGQMLGYCFPDHGDCSQRVVLRFNAQGRLYQVQSSVPHIPPRHFTEFQPPLS